MRDQDIYQHKRTIYTVWDWLGDIGGLFDMLKLLAKPMLKFYSLIFGSGLEAFLIKSLFKVQRKVNDKTNALNLIKKRRPLNANICSWVLNRHNMRLKR